MQGYFERHGISYRSISSVKIAHELGAAKSANLGLLGYCAAFEGEPFFDSDGLEKIVDQLSPERFKKQNLSVFCTCLEKGLEEKKAENSERT